MNELLAGLAGNGPWALVAGFLLWQVIKAWAADRDTLTRFLTEFRSTLESLKDAVDALRTELGRRPLTTHKNSNELN